MCGIAGLINVKDENKEIAKRIFKSILLANESRGRDSTGVLAISRETNEFSLFKDTLPSSIFLNRKKFRQVEADVWIGHTRLATTGGVNIRNAHPLQRKEVFLVHNGVIDNHADIGKSLGLEYQVDSEVLIPIVEEEDWDLLGEVKGSANFIAWNRTKQRLYIERHDNPLYCLTLKELGMVMFSSMKDVLEFIAGHYGSGEGVYEFKEDSLIELDMFGNTKGELRKIDFKPTYTPVPTTYNSSKYGVEIYPHYYDYGDEYEDYDDYMRVYRESKDSPCEGCGVEIGVEEAERGLQEWGFPLCEKCLEELDEANELIVGGKPIDLYSGKWGKFKDILGYYLP